MLGNWSPVHNRCHDNAARLHNLCSKYVAVRGWLYLPAAGSGKFVRFVAHSVVRVNGLRLVDITPRLILTGYPFIEANMDEQTYQAAINSIAKASGGYGFLDYLLDAPFND